jgi:hypothetical protein
VTKYEKAVRLVADGRCHVGWVSKETNGEERPIAGAGIVDGDTDTYRVSYSPLGRICTCPAGRTHRDCSHGIALELAAADVDQLELELL